MEKHMFEKLSFRKVFKFILALLLFSCSVSGYAEVLDNRVVKGVVKDELGEPLPAVTVVVKGTTNGVTTDLDGEYTLSNVPAGSTLVFSFLGMQTQEIVVRNQKRIDVEMKEDAVSIDEVVVVAFGTQKKESMVSSIQTVKPAALKVPSSNLTTALAGRMSGLIAYQRSGEPGQDNADFFIRGVTTFGYKKDPLILIDGIETTSTELARLQPDDIAAFSILKDATATALYGARGANGVIQVQTKEGKEGPAKVSLRVENSFSSNTSNIELADPITYMQMANEAVITRNPLAPLAYSREKIANTIAGKNPYLYPANDWRKLMTNPLVANQRANLSVSGGGKVARYYIAATFSKDNGNLKNDKYAGYKNNIDLSTYQLRSNVNINLTKTTEAIVRLAGTFDDYTGPLDGGDTMYKKIMVSNPVLFPAYYPTSDLPSAKHVLYGNALYNNNVEYTNPYAELTKGYKDYSKSTMDAQFELKQDLSFITKGLNVRGLFNTSRYAYFEVGRASSPYFYNVSSYDKGGSYSIMQLNEDSNPTEYLESTGSWTDVQSTVYMEAAMSYNRSFGNHDVSGLLVYQRREKRVSNIKDDSQKDNLQKSLPYRNQGLSGRFTYAFNNRYMAEFNFGYNGSERFYRSERYGFFPAIGIGYDISNEKFWEPLKKVLPKFKLKYTYGLVGNDAIGDEDDRFFYLSEVDANDSGKSYGFGTDFNYTKNGVTVRRYDNRDITWEKAYKSNYGLELSLFDGLNVQVDYFTEHRTNILMDRESIPSTMGLSAKVRANVGEAKARGLDLSVDYNKVFRKGMWLQLHGNFTYAHSEFLKYEEPEYNEKYKLHVGQSLKQEYGYIAERLFIDEADVANSPKQTFGEYGAGDIKYRDVNGDGQITELDQVPIGFPTVPEIIYGFGFSFGSARFDVSAFFQGSARSTFWLDAKNTSPFVHVYEDTNWDNVSMWKDIPLLKAYADNHWTETNRNIYALWPRLSSTRMENNIQKSTWFMRNGAFLRMKTLEVGYIFPETLTKKAYINSARIYCSGNNLFVLSGFHMWDIEMGGNGLGYPIQRVINLGVQLTF